MDKIVEITKRINKTTFLGTDTLGRVFQVKSIVPLVVGKSVLLRNGIVVGTVKTVTPRIYEV